MIERIDWLGHGSFRLSGTPLIYLDPWRITREDAANPDAILITHDHFDHCSPADVAKLRGPNTVILTNQLAADHLEGAKVLRPWQGYTVGRALIKTLPAYNAKHPAKHEGLGFVVSIDHYDIYFAGDTGLIPEMAKVHADIAVLPIGGNHTMTVDEAVQAVRVIRPTWVIPSHYGSVGEEGGTLLDLKAFIAAVGDLATVVVPERRK
jgi:L-ascorbate metabolism protein UlaG (beta-lactamase superfamily)